MSSGPKRDNKQAFTLVELLVVIAIIGVLVALLLPAVQAARESARRSQCTNNQKNLALACHEHHDAHQHLPVSVTGWGGDVAPNPKSGIGWIINILPELEQPAFFAQFAIYRDKTFASAAGLGGVDATEVRGLELAVLQCPSDPSVRDESLKYAHFQLINRESAMTSYKGVIGDEQVGGDSSVHTGRIPDTHQTPDNTGLFNRNTNQKPISFKHVTDGLSNTRMIGEDVPRFNYHSAAYYSNGDWATCGATLNYKPEPPKPNDWWDAIGFRSEHPGGVNFARADCSVEFVNDDIDHSEYRASCTKAEGEVRGVEL